MSAASYNRGSRAISRQTRVDWRYGRYCTGRMGDGPDKRFARCPRCGAADYEKYEGDTCGRLIVAAVQS